MSNHLLLFVTSTDTHNSKQFYNGCHLNTDTGPSVQHQSHFSNSKINI